MMYSWMYQNEIRLTPQTLLLDHPVPLVAVPTCLDPEIRLCRQACSVLQQHGNGGDLSVWWSDDSLQYCACPHESRLLFTDNEQITSTTWVSGARLMGVGRR